MPVSKKLVLTDKKEINLQTKYQELAKKMTAEYASFAVNTVKNVEQAVFINKELIAVEKEINAVRDSLVRPHNEYVKQVNTLAKNLILPFTLLKNQLATKMAEYNRKVLAKAQEEAQKVASLEAELLRDIEMAREAREAEEMALRVKDGDTKEAQAERERVEDKLRIAEEIMITKKLGKSRDKIDSLNEKAEVKGMRAVWTFEVINPTAVPKEFCSPDSVKINAAIRAGVRQVDGLKIYEKKIVC